MTRVFLFLALIAVMGQEVNAQMWGGWSSWSSCSETCGYGASERTRVCFDGGCKAGKSQTRSCFETLCPITSSCDANSGEVWNDCGSPCTRTCADPNPTCPEVCEPRCECPSETPILHNDKCVAESACDYCHTVRVCGSLETLAIPEGCRYVTDDCESFIDLKLYICSPPNMLCYYSGNRECKDETKIRMCKRELVCLIAGEEQTVIQPVYNGHTCCQCVEQ